MAKPGALLLLLAVVASQVDLYLSLLDTVVEDITTCPISFYGKSFTWMEVTFGDDSSLSICFKNGVFGSAEDCLVLNDRGAIDFALVNIHQTETSAGSDLHSALPNILPVPSSCYVEVALHQFNVDQLVEINIYDFAPQAAVTMEGSSTYTTANVVLEAKFGDSVSLDSWSFTNAEVLGVVFMDVSGCRASGVPLASDSNVINPETCTTSVCSNSAVLSDDENCGEWEVCQGNNVCFWPTVVCTVTGSTVIDFYSRIQSIQDRCEYKLMGPLEGEGFVVNAVFQERRRKDVPFLDHLILSGSSVVDLEQGGRVRVDGELVTLDTTPQLYSGVELSKDQNGVTAKLLDSGMKVFFDGNTAHVAGLIGALTGLCGDTSDPDLMTTPNAEKSSSSSEGCETLQSDTEDSTIDCVSSTERCNLMLQDPFTACHEDVDPAPYVTACTNTLCAYPMLDGLNCHVFEAYAKSCVLKSDITLDDWRSTTGCSVVLQDSCRDQYCSDHEFCGENLGETRCLCRALFAAPYKSTGTLGDETVCTENSATLTLAACLLWEKGIDYSTLHLNDESCTGDMDDVTHMLVFHYDSINTCGTVIETIGVQIVYKNTIMTRNPTTEIINYNEHVDIDFSCFYTQPETNTLSLRIKDSPVQEVFVSGAWAYTLTMSAYTDPGRTLLVTSDTEMQLDQRIWLELKTEGLDGDLVSVVTDSCWATNQQDPDAGLRYDLITDGCSNLADEMVEMEGNGQGTTNYFSFNMFEFFGEELAESTSIYLHCHVELCPMDQSCVPDCSGEFRRRRRSSGSNPGDGKPALITMAWVN